MIAQRKNQKKLQKDPATVRLALKKKLPSLIQENIIACLRQFIVSIDNALADLAMRRLVGGQYIALLNALR